MDGNCTIGLKKEVWLKQTSQQQISMIMVFSSNVTVEHSRHYKDISVLKTIP